MTDERVSASSPKPWTMFTTPGRRAGLGQQLDEALGEKRRVLGRLQDDGVAADERRASFHDGIAIGKFHGVIAPTTPTGIRTLIMNLSRELARRRLAEEPAAFAGHVLAHVDRLLDVSPGLGSHLPHLARHQLGQLVLVLAQELGEPEEDRAARRCRHEPPALERLLRRATARSTSAAPERGNVASVSPVAGTIDSKRLPALGGDPFPADEVLELRRRRSDLGIRESVVGERAGHARTAPVADLALLGELVRRLRPWRRSGPVRRSTITVTAGLSA